MMRASLTLIFIALLCAVPAAGQTGGAQDKPDASQLPQEAERLNAEVVRLYGAGKYLEALPLAARVLELREKEPAPSDRRLAAALINLASIELSLGKTEEAKGHFRRAASTLEKAPDDALPLLISAVEGLARAAADVGGAAAQFKRSLALRERLYGTDSPELLKTLFQLGHYAYLLHNYDEAERHFKRFVEIAEKAKAGPEDDLAVAYLRHGCAAEKKGRQGEADADKSRALAILTSVEAGRSPLEKADVINGRAVSKPQPEYPYEAKLARAEGTIEVEMIVGENGTVLSACARGKGNRLLKEASEVAAYRARFTPTLLNGKPVKVMGVITYSFVLR